MAVAELEPSQIQDLGDVMSKLLEIKAKANTSIRFEVKIELGDGKEPPKKETIEAINQILRSVKDGFECQ